MKLACFLWLINIPWPYRFRSFLFRLVGAKIGKCRVRRNIFVDHPQRLDVGDGSFINYYCHIHCGDYGFVYIGRNVFIGPDVKLCCVSHEIGGSNQRAGIPKSGNIVIEDGAWIGIGSVILPGVTIGAGSVVAAGSVVNKSVSPNTVVGGVPAKQLRNLCES